MRFVRFLAVLFVVVGALNWGLVGFFQYDLVAAFLGINSIFSRLVYCLVGLSGIYGIRLLFVKENYCCCGKVSCCQSKEKDKE